MVLDLFSVKMKIEMTKKEAFFCEKILKGCKRQRNMWHTRAGFKIIFQKTFILIIKVKKLFNNLFYFYA